MRKRVPLAIFPIILLMLGAVSIQMWKHLPERSIASKLTQDQIIIQDMLEMKLAGWVDKFDRDELIAHLGRIAKNGGSVEKNVAAYFKTERKKTNLLRIFISTFSENHRIPKEFNGYVKTFGKLNDAIAAGNREATIELAIKLKKKLRNSDFHEGIISEFTPATKKSFYQYLDEVLVKIRTSLGSRTIGQDELHKVRKDLKIFLGIYTTLRKENEFDQTIINFEQQLDEVVTHLGDIHDEYVAKELTGQLQDEDELYRMTRSERRSLMELIDNVDSNLHNASCWQTLSLFI